MNKDEIEDIKDNLRTLYKVLWNEHREGTYTIERILEYINCLEQKETILDKVTDKLKKDANKKIPLAEDMDWVRCRKEHTREILNIIEGGIKND